MLSRQGLLEQCLRLPIPDWRERTACDVGPTHQQIVEALQRGDCDECERMMREHVESRKNWFRRAVSEAVQE